MTLAAIPLCLFTFTLGAGLSRAVIRRCLP